MSSPLFRAPKGTRDILAPESDRRRALTNTFVNLAQRHGFGEIVSPIFEELGVFSRLGETTEVVSKEMYDFFDKGSPPTRFALRPELTASICRAYVEHRPTPPWKVWYEGPQFRYEQPQAGRYRQFSQLGVELLGTDDPQADIDVIVLADRSFEALGLHDVCLSLNSLGSPGELGSRQAYLQALGDYLQGQAAHLSLQSQETLKRNPLRVLDSKRKEDEEIVLGAPAMVDFLDEHSARHFSKVREGLEALGVVYEVSPRLVRGLDYYTHTTFEFSAPSLAGSQNALGGGGRYDGLVEDLGGPPTPGVGFALGIDRIMLACEAQGVSALPAPALDAFVIDITGNNEALGICDELRAALLSSDRCYGERTLKAQMKLANRVGAKLVLIVGQDELEAGEVTLRNMESGEQRRIARAALVDEVASVGAMRAALK